MDGTAALLHLARRNAGLPTSVGGDCGCEAAVSLMRRLGCEAAARMHEAGAASHPNDWSAAEWRAHIDDEERTLFPHLIRSAPPADRPAVRAAVRKLERDHGRYLRRLGDGRPLDRKDVVEHSRIEDALCAATDGTAVGAEAETPATTDKFLDPWAIATEGGRGGKGVIPVRTATLTGTARVAEMLRDPGWSASPVPTAKMVEDIGRKWREDMDRAKQGYKETGEKWGTRFGSVMGAPWLGTVAGWAGEIVIALDPWAKGDREIEAQFKAAADAAGAMFAEGYMPPMQTFQLASYKGFAGSGATMQEILEARLRRYRELPYAAKEYVWRWMERVLKYSDHPKMKDAFNRYGNAEGLADDDQVMLVAIPYALHAGIDPDAFAVKLWNKSPGWKGAPEEWLRGSPVDNAYTVQFAVLARNAEAMLPLHTLASPTTPILLGALGTGALALAGASGIVLALPVALGLLVALGRRKPAPAVIKSRLLVPSVKS